MHSMAAVRARYRGHWKAAVAITLMFTPSVNSEGKLIIEVPINGMCILKMARATRTIRVRHSVLVMTEYRGFFHEKSKRSFAYDLVGAREYMSMIMPLHRNVRMLPMFRA